MSADSTGTCPHCYRRATGVPVNEITAEQLCDPPDGVADDSLKEYHENYVDQGRIVFRYAGAECRDCGFEIEEFTLSHPLEPPT